MDGKSQMVELKIPLTECEASVAFYVLDDESTDFLSGKTETTDQSINRNNPKKEESSFFIEKNKILKKCVISYSAHLKRELEDKDIEKVEITLFDVQSKFSHSLSDSEKMIDSIKLFLDEKKQSKENNSQSY